MSFWTTSDNKAIEQTQTGSFDAGGGDMEPIPKNTQVKAAPDEVKWDNDNEANRYISLRWSTLAPEQYKGRKIFQKLWVTGENPNSKDANAQADKAKRMLAAINANAKGHLMTLQSEPTDQDLQQALMNKPMALNLQVWEIKDNQGSKKGNWVQKVAPLHAQNVQASGAVTNQHSGTMSEPVGNTPAPSPDFDDDIPF